jgi:hypothetical protein
MIKKDLSEIPEPSWLKEVAPNSCMNAKDLADIFKVNISTMYLKIEKGEFPPPDIKHIVGRSFGETQTFSNKNQWRLSTIRKFFKQQGNTHEKD